MKSSLRLALASVIVGFACFAIMFWVFKMSYKTSLETGIIIVFTGFIIELLKPWIERLTKKRR
jgi:hypothetical protein